MTHDVSNNYFDKFIRPVTDAYLFVQVYDRFKGVKEGDIVLLTREGRVCRYKVHWVQYFTPHGDEFFGKLLWVGYEIQLKDLL